MDVPGCCLRYCLTSAALTPLTILLGRLSKTEVVPQHSTDSVAKRSANVTFFQAKYVTALSISKTQISKVEV